MVPRCVRIAALAGGLRGKTAKYRAIGGKRVFHGTISIRGVRHYVQA